MKKIKIKVLDNGALKIKYSKDFQCVAEVANAIMAAGPVTIMNSNLSNLEKIELLENTKESTKLGLDACIHILNKEPEEIFEDIKQVIDKVLKEEKGKIDLNGL